MRRAVAIGLLALAAASGAPRAEPDTGLADPESLLRAAFDNQYELDSTAEIELVMQNQDGHERRRRFQSAQKRIGDRLHSIGRLTHPEHLRGMTILQVEADDRSHDAFVYLPSMRSVRRVSTAQRGDAFFGTDVTYEDLERRRVQDYRVSLLRLDRLGGEDVVVLLARPRRSRSYHEAHFFVAAADRALLRVDFFKRDAAEPFRAIRAERSHMQVSRGHTLPTRLVVENRARGTRTQVRYERLEVDPEIDERSFSIRTLERRGAIPGSR